MKKYDVPLKIVEGRKSTKSLALARELMDRIPEKELYDELPEKEVQRLRARSYFNLQREDYFEILQIPEKRRTGLVADPEVIPRNYDPALSMAMGGKPEQARQYMQKLKILGIDPMNPTSDTDIERLKKFTQGIEKIVEAEKMKIYEDIFKKILQE